MLSDIVLGSFLQKDRTNELCRYTYTKDLYYKKLVTQLKSPKICSQQAGDARKS